MAHGLFLSLSLSLLPPFLTLFTVVYEMCFLLDRRFRHFSALAPSISRASLSFSIQILVFLVREMFRFHFGVWRIGIEEAGHIAKWRTDNGPARTTFHNVSSLFGAGESGGSGRL